MFTKKMFTVLAWEFIQKVKSKGFIFSMVFMPIVIIGFTLIPTYFADQEPERALNIAIADQTSFATDELSFKLESQFPLQNGKSPVNFVPIPYTTADSVLITGKHLIQKGIVDGFLVVDDEAIRQKQVRYFVKGAGNNRTFQNLERCINNVIIEHHAKQLNLSPQQIQIITQTVRVKMIQIGSEDTELIQRYLAGIILVMMLFFAIFNSGGSFMRGISEEKNNRVIEILISSISPKELMTGKILGLGCVGLTQILLWGLLGALFGRDALGFLTPFLLVCFAAYFVSGYLLFAGIFSVVGSVLSSEHDIQPVQAVLSMIGILPIALAILVLQNPDSILVAILSYIPLLTPTLMILRLVISEPSLIQVIGTMIVLLFSLLFMLKLASKIFHVSLLMQGKRPTLNEVIKWARA
ncbi:ABC transporter permease [bacterium]|nr:ABC transporter permease [bacterium]